VTRLFVRHRVADYTAWRAIYDAFAPERQSLGVTAQAVYQSVADPNEVTAWHDFASQEAAEAFVSSPQLRDAMHDAGVQGAPDVWLTNAA